MHFALIGEYLLLMRDQHTGDASATGLFVVFTKSVLWCSSCLFPRFPTECEIIIERDCTRHPVYQLIILGCGIK